MCAIAGIRDTDIAGDLKNMLDSMQHRGRDGTGYWIKGNLIQGEVCEVNIPGASIGIGHKLLSIVGRESYQPLIDDNLVLVCNGEIYNYQELKEKFELETKTESDCEVILKLISKFREDNLLEAIKKTLPYLDGDYAFALLDEENLILGRDPVGVKPLYYGQTPSLRWAFASEKKALWKVGIEKVQTLPPGHLLFNQNLIPLQKTIPPSSKSKTDTSKKILKSALENSLIKSVHKRVKGLEEVGLVFSGGVDSTLLACLLKDMEINTTLYTVGTPNSPDLSYAQRGAELLDLKLKTFIVDENVVKSTLKPVLTAIEEFNVMKIGVGMPLYLAAQLACKDGIKVVLTGQGADELFGGYHRYLQYYSRSLELTQEHLKKDVERSYEVNLQRDDAVTMAHGVELRVPYLDREVIKVAMDIPIKYKIKDEKDNLRKNILRELALDRGVPPFIAHRPKKAAQYGSGIHKILIKKVLKDFDEEYFIQKLRGF